MFLLTFVRSSKMFLWNWLSSSAILRRFSRKMALSVSDNVAPFRLQSRRYFWTATLLSWSNEALSRAERRAYNLGLEERLKKNLSISTWSVGLLWMLFLGLHKQVKICHLRHDGRCCTFNEDASLLISEQGATNLKNCTGITWFSKDPNKESSCCTKRPQESEGWRLCSKSWESAWFVRFSFSITNDESACLSLRNFEKQGAVEGTPTAFMAINAFDQTS